MLKLGLNTTLELESEIDAYSNFESEISFFLWNNFLSWFLNTAATPLRLYGQESAKSFPVQ